jgi:8-oxo-dGTP pyrophosphatase MutT (NUDIX family)
MKLEYSAGGIVFKKNGENIVILLGQHSSHHGWVFPKGLIGDHIENESKEETALREVEEETGAKGKIVQPLQSVTFHYEWKREKRKKTVYYYLMEYIGGDINKHDWEMEKVEWVLEDKVLDKLTYESDKKVWQQARLLITSGI